jgi:hypothetical protein
MQILGGFAGHGNRNGVTVDRMTLGRLGNDCAYSWPSDGYDAARADSLCEQAATVLAADDRRHTLKVVQP